MAEVAKAARTSRSSTCSRRAAQLYADSKAPLTINGVHLNSRGQPPDRAGHRPRAVRRAADATRQPYLDALRQAVVDKNFHWFNRYRTTDGYATYGDRAFLTFIRGNPRDVNRRTWRQVAKEDVLPTNYEVLQREVAVLDVMTANRDRASGRSRAGGSEGADLKVDDTDTPPFIDAQTNKPGKGPNGAHVFLDGEEAIQKMTVGKGLKVKLFASEKEFPELVNPVQMAFDTQGPALGRGLEELSALAAEDADERQAADPRGHRRRRQGRQADGVRRRSEQPDRLRVLQRRRASSRRRRTSCSSRTPTATTRPT